MSNPFSNSLWGSSNHFHCSCLVRIDGRVGFVMDFSKDQILEEI